MLPPNPSPVVSGLAARVWAAFPDCTSHDVRRALLASAKDIGPKGWDALSGHGLVQGEAAWEWLSRQPCASPAAGEPGKRAPISSEQPRDRVQQGGRGGGVR